MKIKLTAMSSLALGQWDRIGENIAETFIVTLVYQHGAQIGTWEDFTICV